MNTPYTRLLYRIGAEETHLRLNNFCQESNRIEGERTHTRHDMTALETILKAEKLTEAVLLESHKQYAEKSKLRPDERGAYRKVQVYVGRYVPPKPSEVQKLMDDYLLYYGTQLLADSYRAHCMFEQIHPFVDFNGRVGRALWLRLAILEGYDCSLGFLHKFYYQTLTAFR